MTLDADQVCNVCTLDIASHLVRNVAPVREAYEEFERNTPAPHHGRYDCLLMYSGGKDSTYLLDKMVNERGLRVLSYTFSPPFESDHAAGNIRLARERIPATFVIDRDDGVTKVMRSVFGRPVPKGSGNYLDEKLPCLSCRTFFVIRAILRARREGIPYILICADPQQTLTMEPSVRKIVRDFYRAFGRDLTHELFGDEIERLLVADEAELPKIVFPFAAGRDEYDPERIVAELTAKGLYRSSPFETHCRLLPLLNHYSFRNWDCMFYKLNASSQIRAFSRNGDRYRPTYSVRFPRTMDLPAIERELKRITFEIAAGRGDAAAHEAALVDLFRRLGASDEAARYVADNFLDMRPIAESLGIDLGEKR
ncbi:hypothetical protein [Streptosporangium sp. G11]|uniref:hypothetical protein n=1 Tax=Streptosporangium sp. G11 TaxID=3436926 RepID=UPI003EB6B223